MGVNYYEDWILVTCASGTEAGFLLPFLVNKWKSLRLTVRSQASCEELEEDYPMADVVQVDLADSKDRQRLLNGVTPVYHIGPSFHPHETEIGYHMVDAAKAESSFQHLVFSIVLNTQLVNCSTMTANAMQ